MSHFNVLGYLILEKSLACSCMNWELDDKDIRGLIFCLKVNLIIHVISLYKIPFDFGYVINNTIVLLLYIYRSKTIKLLP
jgi:hypothetical protein